MDAGVVEETAYGHALAEFLPPKMPDEFGDETFESDAVQRVVGGSHDGKLKRENMPDERSENGAKLTAPLLH